jgi:hypothetical protein
MQHAYAILSSPDEIGYRATITLHSQDKSRMILGMWMIWPKSQRQANRVTGQTNRERPQMGRLLSAWMSPE